MPGLKRFGAWPVGPWNAEDPPYFVTDAFEIGRRGDELVYLGEWKLVMGDGKLAIDEYGEPLVSIEAERYVIAPVFPKG